MKEKKINEEPLLFVKNIWEEKRIDVKHSYLSFLESSRKRKKRGWQEEGYDIRKLNEIANISNNVINTNPDERYLFVSVHFDGTITPRDRKRKLQTTEYSELTELKEKDVVLSRIDLVNGAVAVVPPELEDAVVSKEFIVLEALIDPNYLKEILRSDYVRSIAEGLMIGMTGRHRVKWEQLSELEVPVSKEEEITRNFQKYRKFAKKAKKCFKSAKKKVKETMEL